ncbi:hypothetical protein GCM10027064_00010 [Microbacterium petrolearium]|jgi:hypothetical protein
MSRPSFAVLILGLALAVAGCAAAPEPEPTPSGFAREEEAFAAAEETYRAYVEAENAVDLSDPGTFEPVYALTTGDSLASVKEELTTLHAEEMRREGETSLASISPHDADLESGLVRMDVCLDVSSIDVFDAEGRSVVSPDRPDVQRLRVSFHLPPATTSVLIASTDGRADGPECQ